MDAMQNSQVQDSHPNRLPAELDRLTAEVRQCRERVKSGSALTCAVEAFNPLDEIAEARLADLKRRSRSSGADQLALAREVKAAAMETESLLAAHDGVNKYASEGVKTAALFMRGRSGFVSAVAAYALDGWRDAEKPEIRAQDCALGALKGAALKAVFSKVSEVDPVIKLLPASCNLPARAVAMGAAARTVDTAFTRGTWLDTRSGRFDAGAGTGRVVAAVANPLAAGVDIFAFGVSSGLVKGANHVTRGAVAGSPFLSTVITGAGFGLSTGGASEALRQHAEGESIDLKKIAASALIQGAVDAVAAAPGGKQADMEANRFFAELTMSGEPLAPATARRLSPSRLVCDGSQSRTCSRAHSHHGEAFSIEAPEKPSLDELAWRLGAPSIRSEKFAELHAQDLSVFKTYRDFARGAIRQVEKPAVVYAPAGHNLEIVVPEGYARALEDARAYRWSMDINEIWDGPRPSAPAELCDRALPEDLVPRLDELPNSELVKRVNLFEERDPDDAWDQHATGYPISRTLASAERGGIINFFQADRWTSNLRTDLNHEWAHLLHYKLPEHIRLYEAAVQLENGLEPEAFNARGYALTNENENWAVHLGEELLALDGNRFLATARQAPVRSAILGRALKWSLTEGTQAPVSLYHQQFTNRADFIDAKVVPMARKEVEQTLRESRESVDYDQVALLDHLSAPSSLPVLRDIARRADSGHAAEAIVNCGVRHLAGRPRQRFEFLWELSQHDYPTRLQAAEAYTAGEIDTLYMPRLKQMEASLPAHDHALQARQCDLADWYSSRSRWAEAEAVWRHVIAVDEATAGHLDARTSSSALKLAEVLLKQDRHADAVPYLKQSLEGLTRDSKGMKTWLLRHCLTQLVSSYEKLGMTAEKEAAIQTALKELEKTPAESPRAMAECLSLLSDLYMEQGRYAEAEPVLVREIGLNEQLGDAFAAKLARRLLAQVYAALGRAEEAAALQADKHHFADAPPV